MSELPEVRSQVPPLPNGRGIWFDEPSRQPGQTLKALSAASYVLHVYANTGRWDGGVQLQQAMERLAQQLAPLIHWPTDGAPWHGQLDPPTQP